jgi:hypothetical protein
MCPAIFKILKYGAFKLTGLIASEYSGFKLCSEGCNIGCSYGLEESLA